MFGNDDHGGNGSVNLGPLARVGNIGAALASFFAVGPLHGLSVAWVMAFTRRNYGTELESVVYFAWFAVVLLLTFSISRGLINAFLKLGALAIARRFL